MDNWFINTCLRVPNKSSIDRKTEDANNLLLLVENIRKHSSTHGKWISISKSLKLKPKQCKRRWKTLRKHFGLGLLTNRQLIDKLQFLKDVSSEVPVSQLRNNLVSNLHALPTTKENSNLILVPLADPVGGMENTFKRNEIVDMEKTTSEGEESEVTEKSKQAKDYNDTKCNEGYDSDLEIIEPHIETIVID